ncbi:hypothetical protein [Pseudomonas sp. K5]|uniref:hypothetical protein n=1 Tax=Pseudomonas sp. K5 TaxID=1156313 RepID=UPI001865CF04|nr:hypothetical protein [Pseudomonas sp. K5]
MSSAVNMLPVVAVLRQMQANSSHFRNGLSVLADHYEGEAERELAAIAAVQALIEAAGQITGTVSDDGLVVSFETLADLVTALILVKGGEA